jgi:hypothetical protein
LGDYGFFPDKWYLLKPKALRRWAIAILFDLPDLGGDILFKFRGVDDLYIFRQAEDESPHPTPS